MMVLAGGVMVLLLAEDGSGVGGNVITQLKSVLCEFNATYNAIGSLAKITLLVAENASIFGFPLIPKTEG